MKYKTLIPVFGLLAFGAVSLAGISFVNAQSATSGYPSIIQKIADKFKLNTADVKAVFDEDRQQHRQQMETLFIQKLDQAVKDGKLTEAQKQLIIVKRQELETSWQTQMQNGSNLTPEQRRTQKQSHMQALKDWATQNGIDIQYLMGGPRGHFGMMHGMGWK